MILPKHTLCIVQHPSLLVGRYAIEEMPPFVLNYGMRVRLLNLINYKCPFAMNFDLSSRKNDKFR